MTTIYKVLKLNDPQLVRLGNMFFDKDNDIGIIAKFIEICTKNKFDWFIGGGSVSYFFEKTTCFTDFDFFISENCFDEIILELKNDFENKLYFDFGKISCKIYKDINKLDKILDICKVESMINNNGLVYLEKKIFKVLIQFDLAICQNALFIYNNNWYSFDIINGKTLRNSKYFEERLQKYMKRTKENSYYYKQLKQALEYDILERNLNNVTVTFDENF